MESSSHGTSRNLAVKSKPATSDLKLSTDRVSQSVARCFRMSTWVKISRVLSTGKLYVPMI